MPQMSLRIKAIRMMNFKSFKDEHVIDGVDEHLNAIVGPNGSGKSNVIDSILFVLGYRAKKMRHSALCDIITKGCFKCYVELEMNEFTLCRECTITDNKFKNIENNNSNNIKSKNSKSIAVQSAYKINNKYVNNNQYVDFLRDKGIDVDTSRFLILQGEIENLSMLGPMDLLEYLEECIGTAGLHEDIKKLSEKVEENKRETESLSDAFQFIDKDLGYKKGRADEKMVWLCHRKKVTEERIQLTTICRETAWRRVNRLENDQNEKNSRLKSLKGTRSINENVVRQLEASKENVNLSIDESEKRIFEKTKETVYYQRLARKIETIKSRIKNNNTGCINNSVDINISIASLEEQISKLQGELKNNVEICVMEQEIRQDEVKIVEFLKQKDKYIRQENEMKTYINQRNELKKILDDTSSNLVTESELNTLADEIKTTRQEITKRLERSEEYQRADEQKMSENNVYEIIRNIDGVYGSVRMLGYAKPGYETAIEAATPGLGNIVVNTTTTAERCIELVNLHKLNRTSFIILDRIKGDSKEDDGLLGNYIITDPMFLKVFWHLLGDTCVCKDSEKARQMAFGYPRRRVVTQDGQLFEKSGIMSRGRVARKTSGVADLKIILSKMEGLYIKKQRDFEINIRRIDYKRKLEKIELQLLDLENKNNKECNGNNSTSNNLIIINERIEMIKSKIEERRKKLPKFIQDIVLEITNKESELEELNKKQINIQQTVGFDIKMAEKELEQLEIQYKNKEQCEFETKELQQCRESLVTKCLNFNNEISMKRLSIDKIAREEALLSNNLEDIEEEINENNKIVNNCIVKINELINEYKIITMLISNGTIDIKESVNIIEKDTKIISEINKEINLVEIESHLNLKNMTDDELFNKSKNIIKIIGEEKELLTTDEIDICQFIFNEFKISLLKFNNAKQLLINQNTSLETIQKQLQYIRDKRLNDFMTGLTLINTHVRSIFSLLTFGGNAELDLVNFLDPFNDGITYNIMPLKKSWKQISNLSGGEKTLASLSLIFALHRFRPSSFYVMDEIDAALDHKNVSLISQYIRKIDAQFIIISLRDAMYDNINSLIAVYKNKGLSHALLLNINSIIKN